MNNYCTNINLDIEPITGIETLQSLVKDSSEYFHIFSSLQVLNDKYVLFLTKLGIVVDHVEVFHAMPNMYTPLHRDVSQVPSTPGDFVKLNYVYGGKDSVMNWYELNTGAEHTIEVNAENNTAGIDSTTILGESHAYKFEDVTWLAGCPIGHPSIVQVGIPHNVHNFNEERFCLSIVLIKDGKRVTMNDAKEIFAQYIVPTA